MKRHARCASYAAGDDNMKVGIVCGLLSTFWFLLVVKRIEQGKASKKCQFWVVLYSKIGYRPWPP